MRLASKEKAKQIVLAMCLRSIVEIASGPVALSCSRVLEKWKAFLERNYNEVAAHGGASGASLV